MTTMLERAARAARGVQVGEDEEGYPVFPGTNTALELARAVLMAVREPDIDMGEEIMANFADPCWQEDAKSGFTAMIDTILNEPQS